MPGVRETMHEFKTGRLRSGSKRGPKVTSRQQAIAIALNQSRRSKRGKRRGRGTARAPRRGHYPSRR